MAKDINIQNLLNILEFQLAMGVVSSAFENSATLRDIEVIANIRSGIGKYIKHGRQSATSNQSIAPKPFQTNRDHAIKTPAPARTHAEFDKPATTKPVAQRESLDTIGAVVRKQIAGIQTIEDLHEFVLKFDQCELKKTAINTVFADGVADAKIMLIGEAPGETEDETGIPFAGRSGILLDKALEAAGFSRKTNLYITNTIFWRPPGNRKPTEEEMKMCKPILEKHIGIIKPKIIILCGATSVEALLQKTGITKINGVFEDYTNEYLKEKILAVPIFHPSFLLRNPIAKKQVWFALLKIKQKYDELCK